MATYKLVLISRPTGTDPDDVERVKSLMELDCSVPMEVATAADRFVFSCSIEPQIYRTVATRAIKELEYVEGISIESADTCSILSISDISEVTGVHRATLSRYAAGQRGPGGFPAPVYKGATQSPVYEFHAVAEWLFARKVVDSSIVEWAAAARDVSEALRYRQLSPAQRDTISELAKELTPPK